MHAQPTSGTAILVLGKYAQLLVVPHPQVYYTGYNYIPLTNWGDYRVLLSVLLYGGMLGFALYEIIKKRRLSVLGWAFLYYLLAISFYSNLFAFAPDTMADRFAFMASVGFCVAFVWLLGKLLGVSFTQSATFGQLKLAFRVVFIACIAAYGLKTFARNRVWESNLTLFTSDLEHFKQTSRPHTHYANELMLQARQNPPKNQIDALKLEAVVSREIQTAISILPKNDANYVLGVRTKIFFGKADEAMQMCDQGLSIFPNHATLNFYKGELFYRKDQWAIAIPYFERAIANSDLGGPDLFSHLAWSYFKTNQYEEAMQTWDKALAKSPNDAFYLREKGKMYFLLNEFDTALPLLQLSDVQKDDDKETVVMLKKIAEAKSDSAAIKRYGERLERLKAGS